MTDSRDLLRNAAFSLLEAAESLGDSVPEADVIREAARVIRANTLHGSFPAKDVMSSLNRLMTALDVKFAVIGGVAVSVHGRLRATDDIDILVDALPPQEKTADADFMRPYGFYKAKSRTGAHLIIDHRDGMVECLVASAEDKAAREWALKTAKPQLVLGVEVPLVTAEALVLLKLKAMSANPRRVKGDGQDIAVVLREQGNTFDFQAVEAFCTEQEKVTLQGLRTL